MADSSVRPNHQHWHVGAILVFWSSLVYKGEQQSAKTRLWESESVRFAKYVIFIKWLLFLLYWSVTICCLSTQAGQTCSFPPLEIRTHACWAFGFSLHLQWQSSGSRLCLLGGAPLTLPASLSPVHLTWRGWRGARLPAENDTFQPGLRSSLSFGSCWLSDAADMKMPVMTGFSDVAVVFTGPAH